MHTYVGGITERQARKKTDQHTVIKRLSHVLAGKKVYFRKYSKKTRCFILDDYLDKALTSQSSAEPSSLPDLLVAGKLKLLGGLGEIFSTNKDFF